MLIALALDIPTFGTWKVAKNVRDGETEITVSWKRKWYSRINLSEWECTREETCSKRDGIDQTRRESIKGKARNEVEEGPKGMQVTVYNISGIPIERSRADVGELSGGRDGFWFVDFGMEKISRACEFPR
ncbi:uncharacterized protein PAC_13129 [Phialocephala subalpina]|uniref:Uncharacterized protein n=1 Tax=Phialocephala subalpina TaxID=576137 RepID=A0A1L7XDY3_9HELO|nr:uncharacterized protein PAC_13129 [Phialocephala subalpina]